MKKVYRVQDLDCANCARKMEDAIKGIEGVEDATVSFLTQKLTVTAEEGRLPAIMERAVKLCRKIEPDCRILLT